MSEPKINSSQVRIGVWVFVCLFAGVVLIAVAIPNFVKARHASAANTLINNLRQTDVAATNSTQNAPQQNLKNIR
jgi:ABC-type Fe3+ transport system permease subunit